jgi:hypothetical protein
MTMKVWNHYISLVKSHSKGCSRFILFIALCAHLSDGLTLVVNFRVHIPRRNWSLSRARAMLDDLIAGFSSPGIHSYQEQLAAWVRAFNRQATLSQKPAGNQGFEAD